MFYVYTESESEVAQSCPTLCNPMTCSLWGSSVHGIFQARVLEWVAISVSRGSSPPRDRTPFSRTASRRFDHLSHHTTFYLFFHLFMDTLVAFIFWLLWAVLWTNLSSRRFQFFCAEPYDSFPLNFWGTDELFSIAAVPFYIPRDSAQELQFLHIFINTFVCWLVW